MNGGFSPVQKAQKQKHQRGMLKNTQWRNISHEELKADTGNLKEQLYLILSCQLTSVSPLSKACCFFHFFRLDEIKSQLACFWQRGCKYGLKFNLLGMGNSISCPITTSANSQGNKKRDSKLGNSNRKERTALISIVAELP